MLIQLLKHQKQHCKALLKIAEKPNHFFAMALFFCPILYGFPVTGSKYLEYNSNIRIMDSTQKIIGNNRFQNNLKNISEYQRNLECQCKYAKCKYTAHTVGAMELARCRGKMCLFGIDIT
jgi:hypothetical protein